MCWWEEREREREKEKERKGATPLIRRRNLITVFEEMEVLG